MFDDPSMPWRLNRYVLAAGCILLIATAGLFDPSLARLAAQTSPRVQRAGGFVTNFGLSGYMFLISAVIATWAFWMRSRSDDLRHRIRFTLIAERAIYFFAAIGVSGIVVQIVKHIVGRTRPAMFAEVGAFHFDPFSVKNVFASFPSGHTTTAFSAAVALSFIAPWARPLWVLAAVLIGISRVVVHAHYPSDVVAGGALGALTSFFVARWFATRALAFDPASPVLRIKALEPGPLA